MIKHLPILLLIFCACRNENRPTVEKITHYDTRDYVTVGKIMDSTHAPHIIDVKTGQKRLVFIGCEHQADTSHTQFKYIEHYFNEMQPQIAFNEGGQVKDSVHYKTINEAIQKDGETGVLKYFADKTGIKVMNGDMSNKAEFQTTLKIHAKEEMYLYYIIERVAVPYKYGAYGKGAFKQVFDEKIEKYFVKNGFEMTAEEKTFAHFEAMYKKYMGKVFNVNDFDVEAFDYINDNCKFCAIGRTSKMVRDSVLLSKIDKALDKYDRVIVTFGHGHALAVAPALTQIMAKKR